VITRHAALDLFWCHNGTNKIDPSFGKQETIVKQITFQNTVQVALTNLQPPKAKFITLLNYVALVASSLMFLQKSTDNQLIC
jgi:hypothetical protein